jgi:hypothetical protein
MPGSMVMKRNKSVGQGGLITLFLCEDVMSGRASIRFCRIPVIPQSLSLYQKRQGLC